MKVLHVTLIYRFLGSGRNVGWVNGRFVVVSLPALRYRRSIAHPWNIAQTQGTSRLHR